MVATEPTILSANDVARRFKIPYQTAILVLDRLGVVVRVGRTRAIRAEDLPAVEAALRGGGFLLRHKSKGA